MPITLTPVNFLAPPPGIDQSNTEGVSAQEQQQLKNAKHWREYGTSYALEHATRPSTIGLVLSSSPLALLAWIGEKQLEWSDTDDIPLDTILSMISLYWFTSSLPRCIWPYRQLMFNGHGEISKTKPLGYSVFKDISITPKAWSKHFPNMKFRKEHDKVSKDT